MVHTDQSKEHGGEGSEPEPFAYFLASLASCAGVFVLGFCQSRGLPTEGLRLTQDASFDDAHRLTRVDIRVTPPNGFPEKYVPALRAVAEKCSVKRVLVSPPELSISIDGERTES